MKCTRCSCCVWSKGRPASSSFRSLLNGPPEAKEEEGKWVFYMLCSPFNILYATPSFRNHHPAPYGQAGRQPVSHSLTRIRLLSFIHWIPFRYPPFRSTNKYKMKEQLSGFEDQEALGMRRERVELAKQKQRLVNEWTKRRTFISISEEEECWAIKWGFYKFTKRGRVKRQKETEKVNSRGMCRRRWKRKVPLGEGTMWGFVCRVEYKLKLFPWEIFNTSQSMIFPFHLRLWLLFLLLIYAFSASNLWYTLHCMSGWLAGHVSG